MFVPNHRESTGVFQIIRELVRKWQPCFEFLEQVSLSDYLPEGYEGKATHFSPQGLRFKRVLTRKFIEPADGRYKHELLLTTEGEWVSCAFNGHSLYFALLKDEEAGNHLSAPDMVEAITKLLESLRTQAVARRQREIAELEKL